MTASNPSADTFGATPPGIDPSRTVGRWLRAPDHAQRAAEGGLRTQGRYRQGAPGQPLVSIVTVCFNAAATIETTIRSVIAQDYPAVEYIVVDGASADGTQALLAQHAASIDYYVSEPDGGLYAAMNKGLALASGAFVLMLNADDWYEPEAVRLLVDAQRRTGADFVSGRARNVDAQGQPQNVIRAMPFDASIRLRMPLRHETMLVPAALYNLAGGYDESYRIIADFKFTLGLFERGCSHHEVSRVVMSFRTSGVSSTALDKLTAERARLLREQFPFLDNDDLGQLAAHGRLSPQTLPAMLQRHREQPRLVEALACFVRDQKVAGAQRWMAFDERLLPPAPAPASTDGAPDAAPGAAMPGLRIATLCSMDHGGAGTGTQRRVEALRQQGVDARIHALVVKSAHPYVSRLVPQAADIDTTSQDTVWQAVRERAIRPVRELPGFRAAELFSLPESVLSWDDLAPVADAADVVHLHWVVGMLDHEQFGERVGDKPVVWTLADMNAFTGGCHYSEGCEGYKRECRDCPLLGGQTDFAHQVWLRKKAAYARIRNLHIVCPSRWIFDRVSASSLLGDRPIHHITNAFPVDRFNATDKLVARARLGLPLHKKLVLFGADSLGNKRKGGLHLEAALTALKKQRIGQEVEVILFGSSSATLPVPAHPMGYISDDRQLALAYSAADVFVSPSDEDSGPMTVGEAMMCGTPVVAFKVGIAMEMITHRQNGYLADRGNATGLADGLRWALDADEAVRLRRGLQCRSVAVKFHDPRTAAERHVKVYQEALSHVR